MTETTEAQAERFHFVQLSDALIVKGALSVSALNMKTNVETSIEAAGQAFGTDDYETLVDLIGEGSRLFHHTMYLYDTLSRYIEDKWGTGHTVPDPWQARKHQVEQDQGQRLLAMLFGGDTEVQSIPDTEDGTPSDYPFGERPEVADGNDPDAPTHGPEDEPVNPDSIGAGYPEEQTD